MLDRIICLIILPTVVAGIALALVPAQAYEWIHTDWQRFVVAAVMFASGSVGGWRGLKIMAAKKGGR